MLGPRTQSLTFFTNLSSVPWVVQKFGGTSLATSDFYKNACKIILQKKNKSNVSKANNINTTKFIKTCVVVSAMGALKKDLSVEKVTSMIIRAYNLAAQRDSSYHTVLQKIKDRHFIVIENLINHKDIVKKLKEQLEQDFQDLQSVLRYNWLSKKADANHWSFGYGELWSARLMVSYLNLSESKNAVLMDTRDVIYLLPDSRMPSPNMVVSRQKISQWFKHNFKFKLHDIIVATGYIASDSNGKPTTLGRDGSDYSASILASLLSAQSVTIWTDVNGVYSANPNIVKGAVVRSMLSYDEASELAYFGAKVLHHQTMTPLIVQDIPIYIRNSFNPSYYGTCIQSTSRIHAHMYHPSKQDPDYGVKGISCINNLCMINVEGTGIMSLHDVVSRLFTSLKRAQCSVLMISQGGCQHSICCAVPISQGEAGLKFVKHEFRDELSLNLIERIERSLPVACLAVVGEGMRHSKEVAGRFFCALSDANIRIIAISQGAAETNISAIIPQKEAKSGLRAVHMAFVDTPHKALISYNSTPKTEASSPSKDIIPVISIPVSKTMLQDRRLQIVNKIKELTEEIRHIDNQLNPKHNMVSAGVGWF